MNAASTNDEDKHARSRNRSVGGENRPLQGGVADASIAALRDMAIREAVGMRVPADSAEDIADEALLQFLKRDPGALSSDAATDIVAAHVRRLAATQARRERRRRTHLRNPNEHTADGRSVPPLCPRLRKLADYSHDPKAFLVVLHAAACRFAHQPRVLREPQLRLYLLAYEDAEPIRAVCRILRTAYSRAVFERLRRATHRTEAAVIGALRDTVTPEVQALLSAVGKRAFAETRSGAGGKIPMPVEERRVLRELCDELLEALRALIHT